LGWGGNESCEGFLVLPPSLTLPVLVHGLNWDFLSVVTQVV
jgi:hypothetical protein